MPVHASFIRLTAATGRVVRDFIDLFAIEGRIAAFSLVQMIVSGVMCLLTVIVAWIFACIGVVDALVEHYDWSYSVALLILAAIHALLAIAMAASVRAHAMRGFFPKIFDQIHGHNPAETRHHHITASELEKELAVREQELEESKRKLGTAVAEGKREARLGIKSPLVIGTGVALLGALVVLVRSRRPRGAARSLFRVGLEQAAKVAVAALLKRSIERRRSP